MPYLILWINLSPTLYPNSHTIPSQARPVSSRNQPSKLRGYLQQSFDPRLSVDVLRVAPKAMVTERVGDGA